MPPTYQITNEPYDPNDEFQELINDVRCNARLHYEEERTFQLPGGFKATQLKYTVTFEEFELTGTETITSLGVMVSLSGHLGCATSVVLANALTYGEPTQTYIDEGNASATLPTQYHDLTAEWYFEPAVEAGVPETRLSNRAIDCKTNLVPLDRLEEWGRVWLKAGD